MEKQRITELLERGSFDCSCGRHHDAKIKDVFISSGAIANLPAMLEKYGCKKAFVLADGNTYEAAGDKVIAEIKKSGLPYSLALCYGQVAHRAGRARGRFGSSAL